MDKLVIKGGKPLNGTIPISGAKNATLPLMCCALLTDQAVQLDNVPALADILTMKQLLSHIGVQCKGNGSLQLACPDIINTVAPYDIVRKMRASILVLGPLVARTGEAIVSLPGGCAIGNRPIDLHLKALEALGATIELRDGYVRASAPRGLVGARIHFPIVSVGATENILMAASLARGQTIIENAAREPEITDLAMCLNAMGAKITGAGSEHITVEGVDRLTGCRHSVIADRIEAGSYAIAAMITGGRLLLQNARKSDLGAVLGILEDAGGIVDITGDGIQITANGPIQPFRLVTQPFPGFPTDMQAQFMALATVANGASIITETIFENRFMHVPELCRLGADITITGNSATVLGPTKLKGAYVMATDLRASLSLVLAGLAATGETHINRLYHLDRGYENLEEKLRSVGADVERTSA